MTNDQPAAGQVERPEWVQFALEEYGNYPDADDTPIYKVMLGRIARYALSLEAELARLRIESTEALANERAISTLRQAKVEELEGELERLRSERDSLESQLADEQTTGFAMSAEGEAQRNHIAELENRLRSAGTFEDGLKAAARIAEGYPPVAGQLYGQDIAIAIRALKRSAGSPGKGDEHV